MNGEEKGALKVIESIYIAMDEARFALKYREEDKKQIRVLKANLKVANEQIRDLTGKFRDTNKLLMNYQRLHPDEVIICKQCGGAGGFDWDDGHGGVAVRDASIVEV